MGIISCIMVRLYKAQPFESEALDRLAEAMKVTPILKRGKLLRYYLVRPFARGVISYPDAVVFDAKYYGMLDSDELLAVGAHEFNHIIKKHVVKRLSRTVLPAIIIAILVGCLTIIKPDLANAIPFFSNLDKVVFSELATALSFVIVLVGFSIVNARWFRQQETECDLSAVEFANGEAMISALKKFRKRYPKSSWDNKLSKLILQTYPTQEKRIMDIQSAMDKSKSN